MIFKIMKPTIKQEINDFIKKTNKLTNNISDYEYDIKKYLEEIEKTRREILKFIKEKNLTEVEHTKLNECLTELLNLKVHINKTHPKITLPKNVAGPFEVSIPKSKIDEIIYLLDEDCLHLYKCISVDFEENLYRTIENYSKHPIELTPVKIKNNIQKYYDELGKKFIQNIPETETRLENNFYEEMIRHVTKTFNFKIEIVIKSLGVRRLKELFNSLTEQVNYGLKNEYTVLTRNILATEVNIINLLKMHNLDFSENGKENLEKLIPIYKDRKDIINGLTFVYYTLYDENGYKLRNKAIQGQLINEDLNVPLTISFANVILISKLVAKGGSVYYEY